MKNNVVNNIRLDINRQKNKAVVHVRAGDTKSRIVHITITDKGVVKSLDDVLIALITIKKPDGNHCYNDLVIQDNELHYEITTQTVNVPGECACEVELTFNDGARITIPGFTIMVYEKYLSDKYVESLNEYQAIPIQIALSKEYAKSASQSADKSAESEANALASAEAANESANTANTLLGLFRHEKLENDAYIEEALETIENDRAEVAENTLLTQQNTESVAEIKFAVDNVSQAVENKAAEILNNTNLAKEYAESASASAEKSATSEENAAVILENTEENKQDIENILSQVTVLQVECQNLANECNSLYQSLLNMGILELGTTHTTAYYGDLGKIAYDHSQMVGNPHLTTYTDVGADAAGSAQAVYENVIAYTDQAIANLINGAPSTLDTLKKIADAMTEHVEVVEALEAAIGSKADATETTSLINQLDTRVYELEDSQGYPINR